MSKIDAPKKGIITRAKLALVSLMAILMAFVPSVSAVAMDFNGVQVVLANLTTVILPAFLDLVIAYIPIGVALAILAFILAFLDAIISKLRI